jgi:periplasmic divalent cation tolerance protein
MTDKIVVLTTCALESDAERMARALVDRRLAACVNVVPGVRSFYHWKGETQSSEEFLLIVKTSRDLFGALRAEMEKLHPYEVPELLALPVVAGAESYLSWLQSNLRGAQE